MFKNLINGEWCEGASVSRNINPSDTRDLVGEFAQGDAQQAEAAVAAARAAFPAWSQSTPQQRFDILDAAGSEILARRLAGLRTKKVGMDLSRSASACCCVTLALLPVRISPSMVWYSALTSMADHLPAL